MVRSVATVTAGFSMIMVNIKISWKAINSTANGQKMMADCAPPGSGLHVRRHIHPATVTVTMRVIKRVE